MSTGNVLKLQQSVVFNEMKINEAKRFVDATVSHTPVNFAAGKYVIKPQTTDYQIGTGINLVTLILRSGVGFNVKIGNTTSTLMSNLKVFTYDGALTNVFISNVDVDDVEIDYVTSTY